MISTWTNSDPIVSLVGAGPGDPGLITVRGAQLLERADVVVYDYLANARLLSYCPRAELIYVGKKAASHSMTQDQINALLVEKGKAGKRVVRLKGGDPFIFGRGGEECLALAAAGLRFEVVPGITAAIGAPAYAGIPVTHRDFNSSFTFITGHEKEEEYKDPEAQSRDAAAGSSDLDWSVIARLPCVAFYMGVKSLPRICAKLIENGMRADMPAAAIRWGTRPQQQTVVGTVGTLADRVREAGLKPPALTIIGQVVSLRETMNWFESRPLFGKTIAVTRTRQQASDLTDQLTALGADVIEAPTIETVPTDNCEAVDAALKHLWLWTQYGDQRYNAQSSWPSSLGNQFNVVIFTSANGVWATRQRLDDLGWDARIFGNAEVAVVGEATARACREALGIKPDIVPSEQTSEGLVTAISSADMIRGFRFLLLRADIARPVLNDLLVREGAAEVVDLPIYATKIVDALPPALLEALDAGEVHWITFTSSSTAKNFATLLGPDYRGRLKNVRIASIGPITTQTLKELGVEPTVQADQFNIEGLVSAIRAGNP
jgi:uroporphyrinogen III methyltransferase/synthase